MRVELIKKHIIKRILPNITKIEFGPEDLKVGPCVNETINAIQMAVTELVSDGYIEFTNKLKLKIGRKK